MGGPMKDETREKMHGFKERVSRPFARRHEEKEAARRAKGEGSPNEHHVDETAGSEFLED